MGIKSSFNQFLKDTCPQVFEPVHLSQYGYKRVAIDISLYLHKFKAVCGDRWLSAFINLIACLRRNEIHCVFIFDGKAPVEKDAERAKRREDREKMEKNLFILEEAMEEYHRNGVLAKCLTDLYDRRRSPTRLLKKSDDGVDISWLEKKIEQKRNQLYAIVPDDFQQAKELFDILKVPYYTAPWEAEKMCSKLCIDGKVSAVLSEDTDVLAYGATTFLTRLETSNDTCVSIKHQAILDNLEINKAQFIDFCIMCGTDYNSNIPKIGSKTAYKHIVQHGGIDEISANTSLNVSVLNHKRSRELFTEFEDYGIESIPYCGKPDFDALQKFVVKHSITLNIEKLRSDFIHNIVVFEDSENEEDEDTEYVIETDGKQE